MTTFLLVRHAHCDAVGVRLAGRAPGSALDALGRRQAAQLAERLARARIDAIYSSPLERAWETARTIADRVGLEVEVSPAFQEIDFGAWTGREIASLERDPLWHRYNAFRSGTRPIAGEHLLEAQARAVTELERLRARYDPGTVVVVSHGDIIRALITYYAGIPLDLLQRLEVEPAAVSTIELTLDGVRIRGVNTPVAR